MVLVEARLTSLDPHYCESNHDLKLSQLVAPGLTSVEQQSMEPRLLLADRIVKRDDRTFDVTLKPGFRFSDGTPVTADDVAFTYMSVLDPAMKSQDLRAFQERFVSVEALDTLTARFHLAAPLATFESDIAFGIVSAKAVRGSGGRFPPGRVIGAGPYMIESFKPEEVRLMRNPRWPLEQAAVPRIRARVVTDQNARALMMVGGSADFAQNSIRLDLVGDLATRERLHLASGSSSLYTYLMMNNRDPILKDVRVRRAIAYAIDRERVLRSKLGGRAVLATGMLPPGHWAYSGDVPRYTYDPDRARALLDEAGYPDPPGPRPRMHLIYKTSSEQFRRALARIWAAQLGEVGIAVEVQSFEQQTFFADIKKGRYQLASMQTSPITEPDFLFTYFHSSRIPTDADPNTHNRWRYVSAKVDELTVRGRRTLDKTERKRIYAQVQRILAEDVPVIPLWHEDNLTLMNVDVTGYRLFPTASFWGLLTTHKQR